MAINSANIGAQIATLRKAKNLTQNALGERIGVSFQAVSKWERGETLPDTAILPELAEALDTTIDAILTGGERSLRFKGRKSASDMREAIRCLERIGYLAGKDTVFYRQLLEGLGEKMNTDIASMLADEFLREILIAELVIQNMTLGYYFDLSDVRTELKYDKAYQVVAEYAAKLGLT